MSASPETPRLLLVENDPCLRRLLSAFLTEEGYGVIGASSLSQALVLTQEQVFNGIFTTLFPEGDQNPFLSIEPLRAQTSPTPIAVLSRCWVAEQEAEQRGYAGVLEFPFRSEAVLQVLARRITRPFSPELAHRADLIRAYLDALGHEEWERLRRLCLPTIAYPSPTPGRFHRATTLQGIEEYLAYAQAARQQLPIYRLEHSVVFEQRGQLVTRFGCSWQGRDGQRVSLAGSVDFRFTGERVSHIGVALPRHRLHALLAEAGVG